MDLNEIMQPVVAAQPVLADTEDPSTPPLEFKGELLTVDIGPRQTSTEWRGKVTVNDVLVYSTIDEEEFVQGDISKFLSTLAEEISRSGY